MRALTLPPVVMIATAVAMVLLNQYVPLVQLWDTHLCWIGIPLIVLGLGTAQWHARLFKRLGTNINTFGQPDILTTDGLYRISRNPMYLGFVVALVGVAMALGSVTPFLALLGFGLLTNYWYIPFEERALLQQFGSQYVDYQSKVRRWI